MTQEKTIGFGYTSPKETCTDKKCPFHGQIKVRGRTFVGTVTSAKFARSITVEWERLKFISKYERFEKRKTKVKAHNPECINAKEGDTVTIQECKPISKTKHFIVVQKNEKNNA